MFISKNGSQVKLVLKIGSKSQSYKTSFILKTKNMNFIIWIMAIKIIFNLNLQAPFTYNKTDLIFLTTYCNLFYSIGSNVLCLWSCRPNS